MRSLIPPRRARLYRVRCRCRHGRRHAPPRPKRSMTLALPVPVVSCSATTNPPGVRSLIAEVASAPGVDVHDAVCGDAQVAGVAHLVRKHAGAEARGKLEPGMRAWRSLRRGGGGPLQRRAARTGRERDCRENRGNSHGPALLRSIGRSRTIRRRVGGRDVDSPMARRCIRSAGQYVYSCIASNRQRLASFGPAHVEIPRSRFRVGAAGCSGGRSGASDDACWIDSLAAAVESGTLRAGRA